jgi:hypothetical protein
MQIDGHKDRGLLHKYQRRTQEKDEKTREVLAVLSRASLFRGSQKSHLTHAFFDLEAQVLENGSGGRQELRSILGFKEAGLHGPMGGTLRFQLKEFSRLRVRHTPDEQA